MVLDLLVSKFDKTGGHMKAIEYDNFIEYVLPSFSNFLHLPLLLVGLNFFHFFNHLITESEIYYVLGEMQVLSYC